MGISEAGGSTVVTGCSGGGAMASLPRGGRAARGTRAARGGRGARPPTEICSEMSAWHGSAASSRRRADMAVWALARYG